MDLNGDGDIDILSGSYSRNSQPMAGLFQVLWGTEDGSFKTAEVLKGTDGEPLIIPADKKHVLDTICTRPTAVDLNGDGKLDIVSGNFAGSFAVFEGKGKGRFAPKPKWLESNGKPITVPAHSDPFFVDWDADGDLDLISGSSSGGVFLCANTGSATEPEFSKPKAIFPKVGHGGEIKMGDAHLTGPQRATRVFVTDVNGDGKLDILVGDSTTLNYPAQGLEEKTARAELAVWTKKQAEVMKSARPPTGGKRSKEQQKKWQDAYRKLNKERGEIIRSEMTGFVWVYYQKIEGQR